MVLHSDRGQASGGLAAQAGPAGLGKTLEEHRLQRKRNADAFIGHLEAHALSPGLDPYRHAPVTGREFEDVTHQMGNDLQQLVGVHFGLIVDRPATHTFGIVFVSSFLRPYRHVQAPNQTRAARVGIFVNSPGSYRAGRPALLGGCAAGFLKQQAAAGM